MACCSLMAMVRTAWWPTCGGVNDSSWSARPRASVSSRCSPSRPRSRVCRLRSTPARTNVFIEADALTPIGFLLFGRNRTSEAQNVAQHVAMRVFAPGTGSNGDSREVLASFFDRERRLAGHGTGQPRGRIRGQPRLAEFEAQVFQALACQHGQVGRHRAFALRRQVGRRQPDAEDRGVRNERLAVPVVNQPTEGLDGSGTGAVLRRLLEVGVGLDDL